MVPSAIKITPGAAAAIKQVMQGEGVPADYRLRVGVRGGGPACASVSYLLGFDSKKEADIEYEVDGIPVVIDRAQSMYVLGMEIDWYEDESQRGFVFNNPSLRKEA
ncbi:MAG TPA: iron-sulfur cluster assembly accessory protein [Bacteroidia bacterium]|nr:iron-sulfur cluster assembly accessory protein [Bacteroidia bacterium]